MRTPHITLAALFLLALALGAAVAVSASTDEVYPVDIVVTTTSDWTDIGFTGASIVVHDQEVLAGAGAQGLQVSGLSMLSIGKSVYDDTAVTVLFRAYLSDPSEWLGVRIAKGHIGETTVAFRPPGEAETVAEVTHVGVADAAGPDNARAFTVRIARLTERIAALRLETLTADAPGGKRVLAFYYPWYGTPDGPSGEWVHWNPVRWHHDSAHDPAAGLYDAKDPETIRRHIAEAKAAGIDGFIASWWGPRTFEDEAFDVLIEVAEQEDFLVTIYYEDAATPGEIVSDLAVFLSRHGDSPALLRVDDLPVVFFYVRVTHKFTLAQWADVLAELEARDRAVFAVADGLRGDFLAVFDGIHTYNPVSLPLEMTAAQYGAGSLLARVRGRLFAATVVPGYDEAYKNPDNLYVDREDGETYRAYWAVARASQPHWVLITSFNEWHEGSEIEPSIEFGTTYLDLTAEEAAAWKRGEPAPAVEPDRDGDGVPDADDYCPDFPGNAVTNGC